MIPPRAARLLQAARHVLVPVRARAVQRRGAAQVALGLEPLRALAAAHLRAERTEALIREEAFSWCWKASKAFQ